MSYCLSIFNPTLPIECWSPRLYIQTVPLQWVSRERNKGYREAKSFIDWDGTILCCPMTLRAEGIISRLSPILDFPNETVNNPPDPENGSHSRSRTSLLFRHNFLNSRINHVGFLRLGGAWQTYYCNTYDSDTSRQIVNSISVCRINPFHNLRIEYTQRAHYQPLISPF